MSTTDEIINNWDHPVRLFEENNLYKLLQVVSMENTRIADDIEELYDQRFLESATGEELEKIGDFVGVNRKRGVNSGGGAIGTTSFDASAESDKKLRARIRAEFIAQASDTTYESFAKGTVEILQANPSSISIITPPDTVPKVIKVDVDGGVLSNSPLTKDELSSLLDKMVSADARVDLKTNGTFAFAGNDSSLKGWNDGTWSSTIEN